MDTRERNNPIRRACGSRSRVRKRSRIEDERVAGASVSRKACFGEGPLIRYFIGHNASPQYLEPALCPTKNLVDGYRRLPLFLYLLVFPAFVLPQKFFFLFFFFSLFSFARAKQNLFLGEGGGGGEEDRSLFSYYVLGSHVALTGEWNFFLFSLSLFSFAASFRYMGYRRKFDEVARIDIYIYIHT